MCYNNQWGGVCSTYPWSQNLAYVVCRQLGYRYDAVASYSNSSYDPAISTFLNVYDCDAHADQLLNCYNWNGYPSTLGYYSCLGYIVSVNCTRKPDVSKCIHLTLQAILPFPEPIPEYCSGTCTNGSIRLVGGASPYKGRVEVCVEGCWGTVCGNYFFGASYASVVCRQLGFQSLGKNSSCYDRFLLKSFFEQGLHQYSMHIMGKVQDQYGCSVLAAKEMSPHCLTVLTLATATTTISTSTILTITFLTITMTLVSNMIMMGVTTGVMLEFIVQVLNIQLHTKTNAILEDYEY